MRNFIRTTAFLLCSLTWISVSVSEFHTVEVRPGEEVTLLCSNYTSSSSRIIWFRQVSGVQPHCICSMSKPLESPSFCSGFQNGKFEMRSNSSTVSLQINQVDLSDSGLYFCGYHIMNSPVIVHATYLQVQGVFDGVTTLMSVILAGLTAFLIVVVICLDVQIRKPHKADNEERWTENLDSDDLKDAALT
ncbi:T-cell surface glycoprotein CD8 beta chain-like [Chaetodon auriga]|uniref:T-cell surface glycoprotein CD8 beta chain-like n=1 Tax=Chaetodon auriga TaxID=39042 RepID=UPI004032B33D